MAAHRIEVINNHLRGTVKPTIVSSNNYRFTVDNNILTKEQRDFYERNGYLVYKKLIPDEVLEKCRQHFLDIVNGVADKGRLLVMKEISLLNSGLTGENVCNKINDIVHDNVFSQYTECPELLDIVCCFVGPNIMAMHSMLINKPPGATQHPPHQDMQFFPFGPSNLVTAVWTAMEDTFKENGCLYVVPGSHVGPLYDHGYPKKNELVNKTFQSVMDELNIAPEHKRVYLPMEKGDTVFFNPLMVHGSGPNKTDRFRKAISCHYAASECDYMDPMSPNQESSIKELMVVLDRNRTGIDYRTGWRRKVKCVRGKQINL